ncbi:MAG: ABC transporter permease [Parabacteroides sp.]|nr:ABC transporter permease [Parabacteroides sp.]
MLKHYLKIAIRQIFKNKVQYLLSVIGIAIGLLCFSMTSYYIRRFNNQFTAWENSDRIANIYIKSTKNSYEQPYIPGKELQALISNPVAGIEKIAYSYGYGKANITLCKAGQKEVPFQCSFLNITADFPMIFGMQTQEGQTPVLKPGEVWISESSARKMFGDETPLGKTLYFSRADSDTSAIRYSTISAVIRDLPEGTQEKKDLYFLETSAINPERRYENPVVLLDKDVLSAEINQRLRKQIPAFGEENDNYLAVRTLKEEMHKPDNLSATLLIPVIGALILIAAMINFLKFCIQSFYNRTRELSLRKCLGSDTTGLFCLLFSEIAILFILSALVSLALIEWSFPFITNNYADPTSTPQIVGEAPSGGVSILLIANLESGQGSVLETLENSVKSLNATDRLKIEDVLRLATVLGKEGKDKGLTMSSKVLNVTLEPGNNFIGFGEAYALANGGKEVFGEDPVELVCTVAAINLEGIILPENPDAEKPEYKSVRFQLDSVFVANVKSTAGLGTWGDVTSIEQSPLKADGTLDPTYYLAPENYAKQTGSLKTGDAKGDDSMLKVFSQSIPAADGTGFTWANTEIPPCYVYPNQAGETDGPKFNYTLLVLRGDYTYSIGGKQEPERNRYYTVIVNDERSGSLDYTASSEHKHIRRNTKYNVTLTIAGSGSDKPFDPAAFAHVAAKVKVADWNVIEIDQPVD